MGRLDFIHLYFAEIFFNAWSIVFKSQAAAFTFDRHICINIFHFILFFGLSHFLTHIAALSSIGDRQHICTARKVFLDLLHSEAETPCEPQRRCECLHTVFQLERLNFYAVFFSFLQEARMRHTFMTL